MTIFFNSLDAALVSVSAEVNLFDMVVLQLVRSVSEEAYEFVYDNGPFFYDPNWQIALWPERVTLDDERSSAILRERFAAGCCTWAGCPILAVSATSHPHPRPSEYPPLKSTIALLLARVSRPPILMAGFFASLSLCLSSLLTPPCT